MTEELRELMEEEAATLGAKTQLIALERGIELAIQAGRSHEIDEGSFIPTPKQEEFQEAVFSGEYLYLALGGGIRGTKTWATLSTLLLLCREYPGSRWAVVRKDLPTLRKNTIPSFKKMLLLWGDFVGPLKQDLWTWTCQNGSEIILFPESLATDPELNRWKGLEVNGFVLEEANELGEVSANKAIERAGSWIIPATADNPDPIQPPPYVFFTFNPCSNWPRFWFYEPHADGGIEAPFYYLPSTAADNPYVPDAVRKAWENLPEEEYARFIEGSWEFTEDPDQLIKAEWILAARNVEDVPGAARLGVDSARFGDDESVFTRVNGNALISIKAYSKISISRQADIAMAMAANPEDPVDGPNIRIDTVGVGGGVADIMTARGWKITELIAGGSPWRRQKSFYHFKNVRSQMWWEAREKFRLGKLSMPEEIPPRLFADLLAAKYRISADKTVEVFSKDHMKTETGRSPDWADSYLHAILDSPEGPKPKTVRFRRVRM